MSSYYFFRCRYDQPILLVGRRRRCDLFCTGIRPTDKKKKWRTARGPFGSLVHLRRSFTRERNTVGGRWHGGEMNTSLEVCLLLSLKQTGLEIKDGWRDQGNERQCHVEGPPAAADGPLLLLDIVGTMGKKPLWIQRRPVEG